MSDFFRATRQTLRWLVQILYSIEILRINSYLGHASENLIIRLIFYHAWSIFHKPGRHSYLLLLASPLFLSHGFSTSNPRYRFIMDSVATFGSIGRAIRCGLGLPASPFPSARHLPHLRCRQPAISVGPHIGLAPPLLGCHRPSLTFVHGSRRASRARGVSSTTLGSGWWWRVTIFICFLWRWLTSASFENLRRRGTSLAVNLGVHSMV